MLGIVAALPAEARSLTGQRVPPGQAIRLGGATLLYVSGMGQARARSAADQLLGQGAQALVSWGTAGALERTLTAGTLILPTTVTDLTRTFYVDPAWHRRIRGVLKDRLPVRTGTLIQSTEIVTKPEQKAELFTRTGAVALDMESAAIGEVAAQAGVPFLVVRGIADCQSTPIPRCAVQAIDEYGKMKLAGLWSILRHEPPQALGSLLRLAWNFRAALLTLRTAVRLIGPGFHYSGITTE